MPDLVKEVGLGGIGIKAERLRALRPEVVRQLMESMAANGLLHPIVVRPKPGGAGYWLVAGRHRFEAAQKLQWPGIPAKVCSGMDVDHAELAEIDENLIRANLSPVETALHMARRKELYEKLHPTTKAGIAQGLGMVRSALKKAGGQVGPEVEDTFSKAISKAIGQSRRTVKRNITRATKGQDWLKNAAGTALDKGDEIDALIEMPDDKRDALIARARAGEKVSGKTALKQHKREQREQDLASKIVALPDKRYGVILADSEWQWEPWSHATGMDRAAANHYPTSCLEVIKSRPVESIAANDCVLFHWATIPMLPHALVVMAAWGFDYVSHYCWGKDKVGTGYWSREKHEILLIGTRGKVPCPAPGLQWDSLILAPRGEHSAKPGCILEMIEAYFPNVPKIELNCRGTPRPGWDGWGLEVAPEAAE